MRPTFPNGYEYLCTAIDGATVGQSAQDEPDWPTVVDATVPDGSITWTAKQFADNARDAISTHLVTVPTGITLGANSFAGTKVSLTISGGTPGGVYDVQVKVTTDQADVYTEVIRITVTD